jgi:hypothetical protein
MSPRSSLLSTFTEEIAGNGLRMLTVIDELREGETALVQDIETDSADADAT